MYAFVKFLWLIIKLLIGKVSLLNVRFKGEHVTFVSVLMRFDDVSSQRRVNESLLYGILPNYFLLPSLSSISLSPFKHFPFFFLTPLPPFFHYSNKEETGRFSLGRRIRANAVLITRRCRPTRTRTRWSWVHVWWYKSRRLVSGWECDPELTLQSTIFRDTTSRE